MTAEPILAALTAPGPTVAAGRGREPASDAGAAFLAVLAGLLAGSTPPPSVVTPPESDNRQGVPLPQSDVGKAPAPRLVVGASAVAGPDVAVPASSSPLSADVAGRPPKVELEGIAIVPATVSDGGVASGAIERSNAPDANPTMRGSALAGRGWVEVEPGAQRAVAAGGTTQQPATPSDAIMATKQLQLSSASVATDAARPGAAQMARAAPDPPVPPPDSLVEPRDASGLRVERPAMPEAPSTSRPPAPTPSPASQLGVEITRAVANRVDHMVVRMEPPELGQVRIDLSFGNDGQLSARIAVERVETLEILQRDAHTLERNLQDAGLRADSGALSFSLRREPGRGEQDGSLVAQAPADGQDGTAAEPEAAGDRTVPGLRLLDIRA